MNAEYESWVETLDTLADPEEMEAIREGEADVRARNVVSFEEAFGKPQKTKARKIRAFDPACSSAQTPGQRPYFFLTSGLLLTNGSSYIPRSCDSATSSSSTRRLAALRSSSVI